MYLGIDLGTSGVKAILVDEDRRARRRGFGAAHAVPPAPVVVRAGPRRLVARDTERGARAVVGKPRSMRSPGSACPGRCTAPCCSTRSDAVLRPAILWNDGRAGAACAELERREPDSRAHHRQPRDARLHGAEADLGRRSTSPTCFRAPRGCCCRKTGSALRLTGEAVSEPSDAAGTLWLDVARRAWSPAMLAATAARRTAHAAPRRGIGGIRPAFREGGRSARTASRNPGRRRRRRQCGRRRRHRRRASGLGVSCRSAHRASSSSRMTTLKPDPERAVHAFCHCLPDLWHRMAVILSGAERAHRSSTRLCGAAERSRASRRGRGRRHRGAGAEPARLAALSFGRADAAQRSERRPASFFGLDGTATRADLGRAALEGVAFALADGLERSKRAAVRSRACPSSAAARARSCGAASSPPLSDGRLTYHARRRGRPRARRGAARLARQRRRQPRRSLPAAAARLRRRAGSRSRREPRAAARALQATLRRLDVRLRGVAPLKEPCIRIFEHRAFRARCGGG